MLSNFREVVSPEALIYVVPIVLMILIGPNSVWKWSAWWAGLFMWFFVCGAVLLLALIQGTFSLKNVDFFAGYLAIIAIIILLFSQAKRLPEGHWASSSWFCWVAVAVIATALLLEENFIVWSKEGHSPIRYSDWWHHAAAPFLFYWLFFAVIATVYAARHGEIQWKGSIVTAVVLAIAAISSWLLQLAGVGGTKEYGWRDFLPFTVLGGLVLGGAASHAGTVTSNVSAVFSPLAKIGGFLPI